MKTSISDREGRTTIRAGHSGNPGESGRAVSNATLSELLASLERQAAEAEAIGATAPAANVYRAVAAQLSQLNETPAVALPALLGPHALDRFLKPHEVEALLGVSSGYAYRHRRELGGVKVGKYVRFPESVVRRRLGTRSCS